MSIYTQQPRNRRPLSGLGALAQMLPSMRRNGTFETFLSADRQAEPFTSQGYGPRASSSMAPARMQSRARSSVSMRGRGMGDGEAPVMLSQADLRQMQGGGGTTRAVLSTAIPQTVSRMQVDISSQGTWTPGTLTEEELASGAMPRGPLTIEGALPMGVAAVLGLALGLTVISVVVGK